MKHIANETTQSKIIGPITEQQIQPNAIDLTLGRILSVRPGLFTLSNDGKVIRGTSEVVFDQNGWATLQPGCYEIIFNELIQVGEQEAGVVIARSSLIRNGIYIHSGLYDSGYGGHMVAAMHVVAGPFRVQRDTRIAQYLVFDAESVHQYDGQYGFTADGEVKDSEKVYAEPAKRGRGRPKKVEENKDEQS